MRLVRGGGVPADAGEARSPPGTRRGSDLSRMFPKPKAKAKAKLAGRGRSRQEPARGYSTTAGARENAGGDPAEKVGGDCGTISAPQDLVEHGAGDGGRRE